MLQVPNWSTYLNFFLEVAFLALGPSLNCPGASGEALNTPQRYQITTESGLVERRAGAR